MRKGHPAEMEDRSWGLHAVIIKKSVPAEDAVEMARDIIKKPDFKKRETKASYRFRAIPKTKFVPKMFRSKKINKDITLVFGELKPEFATLSGRGFFDYFKKGYEYVKEKVGNVVESAKDFFSPRLDDYNNKTKEILKQYGGDTITKATIYRKPVDKWIPQVLNAVSLGKWNQAVKKAGYDKFFHLSLIVVCKGEPLNVEKLDVVSIKANDVPTGDTVETQEVPLENKTFTLFQMLEKARADVGDKAFFEYDSFQNNCQSFVSYLLKGQGLYSEEAKAFVYQPIQQIVDDMPDYVKKFQRGLTDISATFNKISGQGTPDELTVEDIIAFLRKKKSKKAKELLALISTLDKKSKTPFTKETLTGKGWWDSFTRFFTERIPNIAKQVVGAVKNTGERVGQDLKNIFGGANPELKEFLAFLKTKELKKKPTDSQLKKLYKEHKGIKRLQGKGFWDDFKQGFNMVFEPGAKYILKPLATATGALPVVAGLTALGYGKSGGAKSDRELNRLAEYRWEKHKRDARVRDGDARRADFIAGFIKGYRNPLDAPPLPADSPYDVHMYNRGKSDGAVKKLEQDFIHTDGNPDGYISTDSDLFSEGRPEMTDEDWSELYDYKRPEPKSDDESDEKGSPAKKKPKKEGKGKNRLAVIPEEQVEGGASRGANFMKALGASQGRNDSRAKQVWKARHTKEEGDKINESKFGSFDIKKVNKGTQDVIAKTKKMTPDRMIREFHSWLKGNAQLLEPQGRVDGKNQTGLYDLRGLWERFSQERQPAPVAPAPAQEQTIQQLAQLYYDQAGLANRRPIKRQMDERFTPEQVKTALATQRQRIKRAKDRERQ